LSWLPEIGASKKEMTATISSNHDKVTRRTLEKISAHQRLDTKIECLVLNQISITSHV